MIPGPDVVGGARDSAAAPPGVDPAVDQQQGIGQRRFDEIRAAGADDDLDGPTPLAQVRDQVVSQSFHFDFDQPRIGRGLERFETHELDRRRGYSGNIKVDAVGAVCAEALDDAVGQGAGDRDIGYVDELFPCR